MGTFQVITGNVQAFEEMRVEKGAELREGIEQLSALSEGTYRYDPDSGKFTVVMQKDALRECLLIKTYLHATRMARVRLGIGIGAIDTLPDGTLDSDGQAYRFSRQRLSEMEEPDRSISLTTTRSDANEEWDIHTTTLDHLEKNRTENQSEALYWLLKGETQQKIAQLVGISQPSVHSRLKGVGWPIVEKMLSRYERLTGSLTDPPPNQKG